MKSLETFLAVNKGALDRMKVEGGTLMKIPTLVSDAF
jgi:hypothetical protein